MARRLQIFTRLTERQIELLTTIGEEMEADLEGGASAAALRKHATGEINVSEVIRRLLAKADRRLADLGLDD